MGTGSPPPPRSQACACPILRGFGTERARLGTFSGFCTERARLGTFRGLGTERARLGTLNQNLSFPTFSKKSQKNVFFYSKRPPSPAKTEVLHEKNIFFLLKKTTQPRKKLKFGMKKCQKIDKKIDQKICHFFKKGPQLAKKPKKNLFCF